MNGAELEEVSIDENDEFNDSWATFQDFDSATICPLEVTKRKDSRGRLDDFNVFCDFNDPFINLEQSSKSQFI